MRMADADDIISIELDRCSAISDGNLDALAELLDEDLTHTHTTGRTQDRATYLAGLEGKPRETRRTDDLRVQIYGDTAVMTGTLLNSFPASEPGGAPRQVELHALQVWVRASPGWKLVAFASSGPRSATPDRR